MARKEVKSIKLYDGMRFYVKVVSTGRPYDGKIHVIHRTRDGLWTTEEEGRPVPKDHIGTETDNILWNFTDTAADVIWAPYLDPIETLIEAVDDHADL